jgi:hypothetical protein
MVSLSGHIAVKIFMGEFWTGATGDYNRARTMLRLLAMHGFFGPPVSELFTDFKELRFDDERVERVWRQLEEQVERVLIEHGDEVEALVDSLFSKKELTNRDVLTILGKNSLQLAQEEGQEVESVLAELGVNPKGIPLPRESSASDVTESAKTDAPAEEKAGD